MTTTRSRNAAVAAAAEAHRGGRERGVLVRIAAHARTEQPRSNPELAALNSWLDYNRATPLGELDGLTEEQAGQRMVGSGPTPARVVRHMTTMEQFFFVECVGGQVEPSPYYDREGVDWDRELDRREGLQPTSTATWPCANGPGDLHGRRPGHRDRHHR